MRRAETWRGGEVILVCRDLLTLTSSEAPWFPTHSTKTLSDEHLGVGYGGDPLVNQSTISVGERETAKIYSTALIFMVPLSFEAIYIFHITYI